MWLAVLAALRALRVQRMGMLVPYTEELSAKNRDLLQAEGFEVAVYTALGLPRDVETSSVAPDYIEECVVKLVRHGQPLDAIFIGCSAFRACMPGFISKLEQKAGMTIVTSTQAFLWHMLRTAGVKDQIEDYGRLFMEC